MNITRRQRKKLVHLYKQPKFNVGWAAKLQTSQNFVMGSRTCLSLRNVSIPARLTIKIMKPVDEQKSNFTAIILSTS